MHMSKNSFMMLGSKLNLQQISQNAKGLGATYHWFGTIAGMTIDINESVTRWEPPFLKEWETVVEKKIIIMSWYNMRFELMSTANDTIAKISISYLRLDNLFYKALSYLFATLYCSWYLNNMLNDTKKSLENKTDDGD